jgi:hypothetical protein
MKFSPKNLRERNHLRDLDADNYLTLKWIIKEKELMIRMAGSIHGQRQYYYEDIKKICFLQS